MEKKTISINPNLFTIQKSNKKKEKKELPLKFKKPTNLKRELIKKIQNYQNKTKKRKHYPLDNKFNNEFKESIEYLRNIIDENNISNNENTNESYPQNIQTQPIIQSSPPILEASSVPVLQGSSQSINENYISTPLLPDPPYGCLKNSSKPTYRKWMSGQTLKNKKIIDPTQSDSYIKDKNLEAITVPKVLQPSYYKIEKPKPINNDKKLKKKTIKKKYTCGKSKTKKQISIIIKDINTRNKILKEHRDLKKKSIQDIRNYLYKKSFIKVGSTAPDKILRDMYESIVLTGNVNNKNSHILIHNYMNDIEI